MSERVQAFYRCPTVKGDTTQGNQKMADQWNIEKLPFCNIVELDVIKGKTNQGDICPILVLRSNNCRTTFRNVVCALDLEFIGAFAPEGYKYLH